MDEYNPDDFERQFGHIDEEMENRLFNMAMASMVRIYKAFKQQGLNSWEAGCIIASWLKHLEPPTPPERKENDGQG